MDGEREHEPRQRGGLPKQAVWGILLILCGVWLGLGALGLSWARAESLWPVFVVALGVASLVSGLQRPRDEGSVWFGTVAVGVGAFFLYITAGPATWSDLRDLWPVFALIAAVGWGASWATDVRQTSNLAMASVAAVVGVLGWIYTSGRMSPELGTRVLNLWPLILVLVGAGIAVQSLLRRE